MGEDLFGLSVDVNADCFSAVFASGASCYWDARGTIEAGKSVGVVAGDMPPSTIQLVRTYASSGGKVFVDSGAFSAFKKGETVDFEAVFSVYDQLLNGLPLSALQSMHLVMPDVVGDQAATTALLGRYRKEASFGKAAEQSGCSGAGCLASGKSCTCNTLDGFPG